MTALCANCTHEDLCMFRAKAIEMTAKVESENDKDDWINSPVHMLVRCERYEEAKVVREDYD